MRITVLKNGPIVVHGPLAQRDVDGNVEAVAGPSTALCRCGQSKRGLLCDGRHSETGFQADAFDLELDPTPEPSMTDASDSTATSQTLNRERRP